MWTESRALQGIKTAGPTNLEKKESKGEREVGSDSYISRLYKGGMVTHFLKQGNTKQRCILRVRGGGQRAGSVRSS